MLLTMKEQTRIEAIEAVMDGRIGVAEAGGVLSRSVRQVYRMLKRLREKGLGGLVHGNKGRRSPRRIKEAMRQKIVALAKGRLADINDTHLMEILRRDEGITIGRETLRTLLRVEEIASKLKRRSRKYRGRRERKAAFGMMLQIDGSPHAWLQDRGPELTLVGAKDDATNHVWARFESAETTWGYMELMRGIFAERGLPLSLYSDRHTIFHSPKGPTIVEQINNIRPLTQFGRAMEELGITLIKAWSAPAKGRIENQWKTFQDRLVVELRLKKIASCEAANDFLKVFLREYNHVHAVKPRQSAPVFRAAPSSRQLDRILCLKETRTANKDHTVSFEGLVLQILPGRKYWSIARQKVNVLQLRDGSVEIVHKGLTVTRFSPEAMARLVDETKAERSQLKQAA